jgi:hypothetical protein
MAAMARRVRQPRFVLIVTMGALVAGSCSSSKLGLIRSSDATDAARDRVLGRSDGAADRTTVDRATVDGTTVDRAAVDAAPEVRPAADAAGTCAGLPLGARAPAGDCPAVTPAGCGFDGTCDGAGGCHRYLAGTLCAAPTCLDSATFQPSSVCDGQGTCVTGQPLSCAPYMCVSGACYADDCKLFPSDCPPQSNRDASPG